ncbi:DUF6428 family protein [Mucilaginibacter sp. McL0603]|uniref:DUF6428 family protein n=1 Tax=Mucilaginibacter sp. McL0603 TaxID=3415670 RepID=UPI003CEF7E88
MNKPEAIKWGPFKETLIQNPTLDLQFQYAENQWVSPSYHITEIKQAPIVSVDCGGVKNEWTEIIVQLWVPEEQQQLRPMKVNKALSIVDIVEKMLPLDTNGTVKIEFGNSEFDTRQMFPNTITANGENLVIDLRPDTVQCKAIERGGSCGTTATGEECCAPAKQKVELKNLAVAADACCTPGSGCC